MVKLGVTPKKEDFKGPKKPLSSYFAFAEIHRKKVSEDLRAEYEKAGKSFDVKEVGLRLAELWKTCPAEKKAEIDVIYKKNMEIYKVEDAEWKKSEDCQAFVEATRSYNLRKGELSAKKNLKEAGKPKKAPSAYLLFVNDRRPELVKQWDSEGKAWSNGDISKTCAPLWKNLSKEDKKPYEERAANEKVDATAKMDEFLKSDAYQNYSRKMEELAEKHGDKGGKEVIKELKEKKPRKPRAPKSSSATETAATTAPEEPAAPAATLVASTVPAADPAVPAAPPAAPVAAVAANQ
eukprot:GEMP01033918.1.p1 GENE.GEMP01033918.1~~GEMP01033918.1.p1  ORF type:complete len:315 (+),score=72.67 GEMP01033918.1:69-947(+)